jgi:hypothetical protein
MQACTLKTFYDAFYDDKNILIANKKMTWVWGRVQEV